MDDYNIPSLTEAKNEYSIRLITILTPLVIEGLKSILKKQLLYVQKMTKKKNI